MNAQWYYGQDGKQLGPIDTAAMHQLAASGQLRPTDLVWRDGMPEWIAASSVPEFSGAFGAAAPQWGTPGVPPVAPYATPGVPYDTTATAQNGRATTSMWLGISSIVTALCCALLGLGLGIAAVITSSGIKNATNKNMAKTGMICGIVGIVLSIISAIIGVMFQLSSHNGSKPFGM